MHCPFCNLEKEKTRTVFQGENVFVVLSNPRLAEGHLLAIPRRHVERLSELDEKEKKELLDTAIQFQEKILSKVSSGCDVRQNYRPFIKEGRLKVNHLHIHLIPRELEDALYKKSMVFEKEVFKDLREEEKNRFTKLFSD